MMKAKSFIAAFLLVILHCHESNSGAVQFTQGNFDQIIASTELVFVNFYAEWCRFSNMLSPIWDATAELAAKELPGGRVVVGKVDCDAQQDISMRFHISKYPTLKLLRNGRPAKREYRGQRSAVALVDYLRQELKDPITVVNSTDAVTQDKQSQVIGFFSKRESPAFVSFQKMALAIKDDCKILAGFGEVFRPRMPGGMDTVVVRKAGSNEDISLPNLDIMNTDKLTEWAHRNCVPVVREITFSNAEELTEEGLSFMILFHNPDDKDTPARFSRVIETELFSEREKINFLTADGIQFAHPLHHLGKSKSDLPLIAIDSFRHMYIFPDIKEMDTPGRLKQFLDDLHSGKLHREFHYGVESSPDTQRTQRTTYPPPVSVFRKLAPSGSRYSLLRDEL